MAPPDVPMDRLRDRTAALWRCRNLRAVVLEGRGRGGTAFLLSELFRAGGDDWLRKRIRGRAAAGAGDGAIPVAASRPVFVRCDPSRCAARNRRHVSAGLVALLDAGRGIHLARLRSLVERARATV